MRWTLAWVLVGLSCAPAASAPEPSVAATSTPDPSARSPGAASQPGENRELALELAEGLVAACASAPQLAAAAARKRCADGLSALAVLRERASEPLLWGAQRAGTGYDIAASQTTQMNALVLRRMYLSTFEFGPEFHLVEDGGQLILRSVQPRPGQPARALQLPEPGPDGTARHRA